jgi:hypothetical protein
MGDAGAPRFVSWLRMAPLPAGESLQAPDEGHAMRATVHAGSRGKACRWSAIRVVEQVSARQTSLSQPSPASRNPRLTLLLLRILSPNPRLTLLRTAALSVLAVLRRQHACRGCTSRRRRHLTVTAGASTAAARRGSVFGSVQTACCNAWSLWLGRAVGRPTDNQRILPAGGGVANARWRGRTKVWPRGVVSH